MAPSASTLRNASASGWLPNPALEAANGLVRIAIWALLFHVVAFFCCIVLVGDLKASADPQSEQSSCHARRPEAPIMECLVMEAVLERGGPAKDIFQCPNPSKSWLIANFALGRGTCPMGSLCATYCGRPSLGSHRYLATVAQFRVTPVSVHC